ncbi:methyltransferase domain-containing protein [Clostridium sp. 19966]|uniref:class I SAM-dependent DNA methyltransferase n=1 Tax=Clostridium sp. 19966 TaxID=2768166 RepID=UPI0028DDEAB4|nr:methyltransferase domain-containing protein [Clostridium sp. 19966]MDT8716852.1 methyltransferase domain-containing protein [Clostridium sp. 19966]
MNISENHAPDIEEMGDFFNKRADTYESHMMNEVDGYEEYYAETARYIPKDKAIRLLDIGCGTGLELEEIFKLNPFVKVTGIDLADKMLERLREKYSHKKDQISLINDSYFHVDYGRESYDAALSVMTLHHFTHEEKLKIYKKLYDSLVEHGMYIETDYTAENQEQEDYFYGELKRIKKENNIKEGFYHYDTPCTVENIIMLLKQAGFKDVQLNWRKRATSIITAVK